MADISEADFKAYVHMVITGVFRKKFWSFWIQSGSLTPATFSHAIIMLNVRNSIRSMVVPELQR